MRIGKFILLVFCMALICFSGCVVDDSQAKTYVLDLVDSNSADLNVNNFWAVNAWIENLFTTTHINVQDVNAVGDMNVGGDLNVGGNLIVLGDANFNDIGVDGNVYGNKTDLYGIDRIQSTGSKASGKNSAALGGEGWNACGYPKAEGDFSFVFGGSQYVGGCYDAPIVTGDYSAAFGVDNNVTGETSLSIGFGNECIAERSLCGGFQSYASGIYNIVYGNSCYATNTAGIALGATCISSGAYALCVGNGNEASGYQSVSLGGSTEASGFGAMAINQTTKAKGNYSLSQGVVTEAIGGYGSFAGGFYTDAVGDSSFAFGNASGGKLFAIGDGSVAMGFSDVNTVAGDSAADKGAIALGYNVKALNEASVTLGKSLTNYNANSVLVNDLNVQGMAYFDGNIMIKRESDSIVFNCGVDDLNNFTCFGLDT